jgi:hypothetical protein
VHRSGPFPRPLGQAAEADGVRSPYCCQRRILDGKPVPGDCLVDGELGLVVRPNHDAHGSRWRLRVHLNEVGHHPTGVQPGHSFPSQLIIAHAAYY